VPLAIHLANGRLNDITQARTTLELVRVPRRGRPPRTRPRGLAADKGYDSREFRHYLSRRKIRHSIPLIRIAHRRKIGRPPGYHREISGRRWVIERLWRAFDGFRRLMLRHERRAFIHLGLLQLASGLICLRQL